MKKFLAVVLAVVMMCGVVMAQDAPAGNQAGAKSMNFTFGGLGAFGLNGSGPSGGLGLSYFLSSDAAVRLGLQVGTTSTTTPAAINGNSDAKSGTFDLALGADYLMYMNGGRVKPYVGAGVGVALGSSSNEPSVSTNAAAGTVTKVTNTRFADGMTLSVVGIAGAEFYLYNEVSLSAEYTLGLLRMRSGADSETTVKGAASVTAKGSSSMNLLGFGAAGATLHIYF
jgi:opacity protein-like surface antigen